MTEAANEQPARALNIFQRVNEVRKEVDYIQKDKKVESYMAVTHDNVTAVVRPSLIRHGIVVVPFQVAGATVLTGTQTAKQTPIIRYEAAYGFEFVNIDNPEDKFTVSGIQAHANDTGDKAPGKALSYAKKAVMLKVFEIETGENEESRVDGVAFMADAEIKMFTDLLTGAPNAKERARIWKLAADRCRSMDDMEAYKQIKAVAEKLATDKKDAAPEEHPA